MASSALDISSHDHVATFTKHAVRRGETTSVITFSCVVVSDGARLEMLVSAVENSGWDTIQRVSANAVGLHAAEELPHLLIVDLAGSESPEECRAFIEKVAGTHGLLLLVCGHEGDPTEEIWARALGVWLYLPGVEDDADLSSLCFDALRIAERNQPLTIELHASRS